MDPVHRRSRGLYARLKSSVSPDLRSFVAQLHRVRQKIIFTNGVFDILHAGHVDYLTRAKANWAIFGDRSQHRSSVKVNKGDQRHHPRTNTSPTTGGLRYRIM